MFVDWALPAKTGALMPDVRLNNQNIEKAVTASADAARCRPGDAGYPRRCKEDERARCVSFDRKTWTHAIAAVVIDKSRKKNTILRAFMLPSDGVRSHYLLHLVKCCLINNRVVFAGEPLTFMAYFTKVCSVLEEMGKRPVGQANTTEMGRAD
jgi:hypothetical protein